MESETLEQVNDVFKKYTKFLKHNGFRKCNSKRYYSDALVMWLMIVQRLYHACSMANLLEYVSSHYLFSLADSCKRKHEKHKPQSTGGYSQARKRILLETIIEFVDSLCEWMLRQIAVDSRIYVIDGSTITMQRSEELAKKYPTNKMGYYPQLHMLTCAEINSGIMLRPEVGAKNGSKAQGEITLFKQMITRIPSGSLLMGDRNFGIFVVVKLSTEKGIPVLFRLTDARAESLYGGKLPKRLDKPVVWKASQREIKTHPELSKEDAIEGRLICKDIEDPNGKSVRLVVFTTTDLKIEEIVKIYQKRWRVEVDIRDLKVTAKMDTLRVNSEDMALKELYIGTSAYNLTRQIISIAAQRLNLDPRKISFSRMFVAISVHANMLIESHSKAKQKKIILSLLEAVNRSKLPNRKNQNRHAPREVATSKPCKYPSRQRIGAEDGQKSE